MGEGVAFGYSAGGLTDAAAGHDSLRGGIEGLVAAMAGTVVAPAVFGTLPEAESFARGLEQVRQGLEQAGVRDGTARGDQSQRTSVAALLGTLLDQDTGAMAAAATPAPLSTPGSILEQMGGG